MAKVKFSGIAVVEASGSVNDLVYTRNRGGHIQRAKGTTIYAGTPAQLQSNARIATLTDLWQNLDEASRQLWNKEADKYYLKNVIATRYRHSGYNLFIQQTSNILLAGGSPTLLPQPKSFVRGIIRGKFEQLDALGMQLSFTLTGGGTVLNNNMALTCYASEGVSTGINYRKSNLVGFFQLIGSASTLNLDCLAEYISVFGGYVSNTKIFVKARITHQISGCVSPWFFFSGIVE